MKKVLKYTLLIGALAIPTTVIPLTMTSCNSNLKDIIDKLAGRPNDTDANSSKPDAGQEKPAPEQSEQDGKPKPGVVAPSDAIVLPDKPTTPAVFGETSSHGNKWNVNYNSFKPSPEASKIITKEMYQSYGKFSSKMIDESSKMSPMPDGATLTVDIKVEGDYLIETNTTKISLGFTEIDQVINKIISLVPEKTGPEVGKFKVVSKMGPIDDDKGAKFEQYLTKEQLVTILNVNRTM